MQKRGISIDALVLIFSFIVFAQLLSYVIPQGAFERVPVPDSPGRTMVAAGTYTPATADGEVRDFMRRTSGGNAVRRFG